MCGVQAPGGGEQSRENVAVVRGGLPARVVTLEVQPGGGAPGTCLRPGRGAVAGDSDVDECGWRLLRQVRLRGEWFISWSECCSGLVMEMDITKMIFLPRQTYGGIIRFNKIDHS